MNEVATAPMLSPNFLSSPPSFVRTTSVKRRRSEPAIGDRANNRYENDRDCYEEVMAGVGPSSPSSSSSPGGMHRGLYACPLSGGRSRRSSSLESAVSLRYSWLRHVEWVGGGRTPGAGDGVAAVQRRGTSGGGGGGGGGFGANGNEEDDDEEVDPVDKIRSLSNQLAQVKRRLGPAAERCTEAWNSYHDRSVTTGHREFIEARRACNPYEILGEGRSPGGMNHNLFMNRSAVKLANMDAVLNFSLTERRHQHHRHQPPGTRHGGNPPSGPFVFVDLCGAPGGFSEYIIRRCAASSVPACIGYGMSLLGSNEHGQGATWKLHDTSHMQNGTYTEYHVCAGSDGTGDVFNWNNVLSLHNVLSMQSGAGAGAYCNDNARAHLVMADGGFDAQRDSEYQEELTTKLVVCEVAAGLSLLRQGGTLLVKMFGFRTVTIRAVMKDLFEMFDDIISLKPISSRPASAERYVVCTGFNGVPGGWDGPRWRDGIFLADEHRLTTSSVRPSPPQTATTTSSEGDHARAEYNSPHRLYRYLDVFDRDLLALNLKACFAILSYLENKCMGISRTLSDSMLYEMDDGDDHSESERSLVNVEAYKFAWKLF